MKILVFKTNVSSRRKAKRAGDVLAALPTVCKWNFDLDDCDKVLRIEATKMETGMIEKLLRAAGFACEELDY